MQQTWCFDFDSTLFDLLGPWVAAHNRVYEKQMTVEEITDWGMENFADPVCGNKIYDLVTPELYEEVKPFPLALEAVEAVMGRGHTVTFATSVLPATVGGVKLGLLRKYGFLPKGKVARDYYLETWGNKGLALNHADLALDDYHNSFSGYKGLGILLWTRYNEMVEWPDRVRDLREFIDRIPYYEKVIDLTRMR